LSLVVLCQINIGIYVEVVVIREDCYGEHGCYEYYVFFGFVVDPECT